MMTQRRFSSGAPMFQSPFGDGRFLTAAWAVWEKLIPLVDEFQSPFGDGRFLTPQEPP